MSLDTRSLPAVVESTAEFSPCRCYRYELRRRFEVGSPADRVAFIGLNPSTADAELNDPTVRRCMGFAADWGFGELVMLNLYALRSTDPRALWTEPLPQGQMSRSPESGWFDHNLEHVVDTCTDVDLVVCAWGANPGPTPDRADDLLARLAAESIRTVALEKTKHGHPKHPLYVRRDVETIPYPDA